MTDPLEPNDLSHLSDEEFNALCPIGHHAPGPEPLSRAAQTVKRDLAQIMQVLSKYCRVSISATDTLPITLETNDTSLEAGINALCAAALRACADQVVPEPPAWQIGVLASADREIEIRHEILAIAAELEGANGSSSTHQSREQVMSKQVKVRIAVCVDPAGDWSSGGWKTTQEDELISVAEEGINNDGYALYWVEATLDVPEYGKAVQGVVSPIAAELEGGTSTSSTH